MRKQVWTGWIIAAALSIIPVTTVQAAERSPAARQYWGEIRVDHASWRKVPYLSYEGTSYVGLWYVIRLLQRDGISARWVGKTLSVSNLPVVIPGITTTVNASPGKAGLSLSIGGSPYVDLSSVAKVYGWPLHYNATKKTIALGSVSSSGKASTAHFLSGNAPLNRLPVPSHTPARSGTSVRSVQGVAVKTGWAAINSGKPLSVLTAGGTSYVGIWYIMQYLRDNGYSVTWHNGTLDVAGLPMVIGSGTVQMGDNVDTTVMAQYQGDWYVPLSTLMYSANVAASVDPAGGIHVATLAKGVAPVAMSITGSTSVTVQLTGSAGPWTGAKVALIDKNGTLHVAANTSASNSFTVTLPGPSGEIVGLYTPSLGWIGQTVLVDKTNNVATLSTDQALSMLSGRVTTADASNDVSHSTVELRSDLTHVHYLTQADASGTYHIQVPVGPYEVWTVSVGGKPLFLGKRFLAKSGECTVPTIHVPAIPTNGEYMAAHADVVAQSKDVTPLQLISIANMFERILPYDTQTTGLTPQLPLRIQVYEKQAEYTQHFIDQDYSTADSQSIGQYSQAVSEGPQDISVDLDGLTHEFGVDVLAHEFTHSLIDNISQNIPSWVNEGIAWHQGIGAELDISPSDLLLNGLQWNEWEDIVNHQYIGDLYPLGGADALAPKYNVEAQDYFAVALLIQQYGEQKVVDYIKQIDALGSENAFQKTFHESIATFTTQVTSRLKTLTIGQNNGMQVTIRMLPGSPSQIFISNPNGKTYWFSGTQPGSVYTFTLAADGSVTAPSSLTAQKSATSTGDGTWDVGTQSGQSQGFFAIDNSFGLGYLQSQNTFFGNSSTPDAQIASELSVGIQLVNITPKTVR